MNPHNLKVGQEVFSENKEGIHSHRITSIGKKYFYITGSSPKANYSLETLKYENKNFTQFNKQLYLSKQEIEDKNELYENTVKIANYFDIWRRKPITLDQTRQICKILEI